jgi:hypothetical protein
MVRKLGLLATVPVIAGLLGVSPAQAQWGPPHRGDGAAIVAGGLLGLAVGATLAGVIQPPPPPPRVVYAPPPPPVYYAPAPVYYAPAPVYYAPAPVYYAPPPPPDY